MPVPVTYSCTVNVNCFPVRDSNRFGVLMSSMAMMAMVSPISMKDVTKMPDRIGAVVNPTQSQALSNFVFPSRAG